MSLLNTTAVWLLFFASTVFGHVGMKLAVQSPDTDSFAKVFEALLGPWGVTAFFSWCLSAVLWACILSSQSLFEASSISTIRYGLVILAAFVFLAEPIQTKQWMGMVLIGLGVLLVVQKN